VRAGAGPVTVLKADLLEMADWAGQEEEGNTLAGDRDQEERVE
jgi:hypothetical protein